DELEMSSLVSELAIIHLKHYRLLEAADLLIEHGWLCFSFGNGPRLARVADEAMAKSTWRDGDKNEIGGVLLHYLFASIQGQRVDTRIRAQETRHVLDTMQAKGISLTSHTQVRLLHFIILWLMNTSKFEEAQTLLQQWSES